LIKSFHDKDTEDLYHRKPVRRFQAFERIARRKLAQLTAATQLGDLIKPPGNHLEKLDKDRAGQHSIRISDQWRVCFRWEGQDAYEVEITDYH
jgi:toxin HigB-1